MGEKRAIHKNSSLGLTQQNKKRVSRALLPRVSIYYTVFFYQFSIFSSNHSPHRYHHPCVSWSPSVAYSFRPLQIVFKIRFHSSWSRRPFVTKGVTQLFSTGLHFLFPTIHRTRYRHLVVSVTAFRRLGQWVGFFFLLILFFLSFCQNTLVKWAAYQRYIWRSGFVFASMHPPHQGNKRYLLM